MRKFSREEKFVVSYALIDILFVSIYLQWHRFTVSLLTKPYIHNMPIMYPACVAVLQGAWYLESSPPFLVA